MRQHADGASQRFPTGTWLDYRLLSTARQDADTIDADIIEKAQEPYR